MKTKTYNINPSVIKEAIVEILVSHEKPSKNKINQYLDSAIYRIITEGSTDLTLFPGQINWDDAFELGYSRQDIDNIYNKIYNK